MEITRKLVLYVAASIDGYIADAAGGLDWLHVFNGNYGYNDFIASVDTVLMGRKTYDAVLAMGVPDPYPSLTTYVFTRSKQRYTSTPRLQFVDDDPVAKVRTLRAGQGKDIFLVGGGELLKVFIEQNMIDRYIVFTVPVLLGSGIPLFVPQKNMVALNAVSTKKYPDGMIETQWEKKTT